MKLFTKIAEMFKKDVADDATKKSIERNARKQKNKKVAADNAEKKKKIIKGTNKFQTIVHRTIMISEEIIIIKH